MHAIIAGGGVSGLATALALHQRHIPFDLYERTFESLTSGMGFVLVKRGIQTLNRLGVDTEVLRLGQPLKRFVLHTASGQVKYTQSLGEGTVGVRRKDLLAALLRPLPSANIHFGESIESYVRSKSEEFMAVELGSGRRVFGDVFIAADGVRSVARKYLDDQWINHDARVCEIVGIVRETNIRASVGNDFHKYQHCNGGIAFGLLPVDAHHVVWYAQFDRQKFGVPGDIPLEKHLFVSELVAKWAKPIAQVIGATNFEQVHIWRPINTDPLSQFFVSNLAFVGDAAHPLLPFTSQGVSAAIADAECLGEELFQAHRLGLPLNEALFSYSKERRQACLPYITQGRELTDQFLSAQNYHEQLLPIAK